MRYVEVAPTRIVRAGSDVFTYQTELTAEVGSLVLIPIGSKTITGLVMKVVEKPAYATKDVATIITEQPLPTHLVSLAKWLSDYYKTPLATVLQTILPSGITKKRRPVAPAQRTPIRNRTKNVLNTQQRQAVEQILQNEGGTSLLQGVTGSGKTEVYKAVARHTIKNGQSVIILVPEIGLTRQVIDEFSEEFPDALVTHSHMTEAARHTEWLEALNSTTPRVIIGPRSALFMPVSNLGAIIVDEAHEPSYKQEQAPRYSALRASSILGALCNARVVFGSATPLVTDRFTAEHHKAPIIYLTERAKKDVALAQTELVDMTNRDNTSRHPFLSRQLLSHIESALAAREQVLLFHNRRGSASTTLCEQCGWTALCERCHVPLVLHGDSFDLTCHICNSRQKVPTACPVCANASIIHKGVGTKRIESELKRLFPKARLARFDSDNGAEETLSARYHELYSGDVDIIIGTQVVAKGLDLPHLRTVGIIQADSGLALPDFMAHERTFELIAQVIGRVGRDHRETSVIIQTYQPTHPVIGFGVSQDYEGFYKYTLDERRRAGFPPFRHLLQLTAVYKTESAAIRAAKSLAATLALRCAKDVEILGPAPAFYERQRDTFRWQLLLKSPVRQHLIDALEHLPPAHWQSELDPASLL